MARDVDIERRLISKISLERNVAAAVEAGVEIDWFSTEAHQRAFKFQREYWQRYRKTPHWQRLQEQFPEYRVLLRVLDPLEDCIDRVKENYQSAVQQDAMLLATQALKAGDNEKARLALAEGLQRAGLAAAEILNTNMPDIIGDRIDLLRERMTTFSKPLLGLPTSFPTLDLATNGLQPQQLFTVVGVKKAGKSTLLLLMAKHIQSQGKTPYFVSFEMSNTEQMDRYISLSTGIDYTRLTRGRLTASEEKRLKDFQKKAARLGDFRLCSDIGRVSTVSHLEARVVHDKPDVVFIDGAYLMRDEGAARNAAMWEKMTGLSRDLKRMAQHLKIPVVISIQALESKTAKGGRLTASSAGYADAWGQDCDVMIGMERPEDQAKRGEAGVRILISRHCAAQDVIVEWDYRSWKFGRELAASEVDDEDDEDDD